MEYSFTPWTWFWIFFPMPLLIVWALVSYVKAKKGGDAE
ncbi:hypothetical protein C8J48_1287 [Desmospora activa DSM 45169]|uniref:Uncharacterized protein n=1 Tax=Desmospora activa DSM 45169 TaxID=1121389 RepID=A0A2T4Z9X9_9BACL|nr:hypothetical protein C8J48_1287 [Desmospora activa DSM 45169]